MRLSTGSHETHEWDDEEHLEEGKRIADAFIREHRMENDPGVMDMATLRAEKSRSKFGRLFH